MKCVPGLPPEICLRPPAAFPIERDAPSLGRRWFPCTPPTGIARQLLCGFPFGLSLTTTLVFGMAPALRELDPDVPLASVEPMEDILSGSIRDVRFRAGLLAGFDVFQDPAALTIGEIRGGALVRAGGYQPSEPRRTGARAHGTAGRTEAPFDQRELAKRLAHARLDRLLIIFDTFERCA